MISVVIRKHNERMCVRTAACLRVHPDVANFPRPKKKSNPRLNVITGWFVLTYTRTSTPTVTRRTQKTSAFQGGPTLTLLEVGLGLVVIN